MDSTEDRSLGRWAEIISGKFKDAQPRCPDHPEKQVIRASLSCTDRSVWGCIICGKRLGDAGPREEPVRESFKVKKES